MDAPAQSTGTTANKTTRSGTARATVSARGARSTKPSETKTVSNGVDAKKAVAKKTVVKQAVAKQATAKKTAAKKTVEGKPPARKVAAKKTEESSAAETTTAQSAAAEPVVASGEAQDEPKPEPESTIESVRAYETPIFAAMFAGWDGPAAGMIGRNLHRADDDTMVFDNLMWRPRPDGETPALRFYVSGERHAPVITVTGELKPGSVALLTTPLRHILRRRPRQLIVDLAGITAASRAALHALLDVRQAARAAHVDFWLRSPSEPVRELLQPANAQVAAGPKTAVAGRLSGSMKQREAVGDAASGNQDQDSAAESTSQVQSLVLEGVVVQGTATRARPWWSSHALRESLRRVGAHQHSHAHAHGHGAPT